MRLFWVWWGGSFQGSREEDDIWSRRVKRLSLGMPRGSSLHISRRLKHLSLGMPKASPSSSTNYQVPPLKLYFYSITSYVLYLERLCAFIFVFVWINSDPSILCVGERHSSLFHMNTGVLCFTFNVHGEGWKPLHSLLFGWKQKMLHVVIGILSWIIWYLAIVLSLVWRKFSRVKRGGWYNMIKKCEKSKIGDAPVVHPCIFLEDSSI